MSHRITGYGRGAASIPLAPVPTTNNGVPTSASAYDFGQLIKDTADGNWYLYSGGSTFLLLGSAAGNVSTLTGDTGGAVVPTAGNITISGGSTGFTFAGAGSTLTLMGSGGGAVSSVTGTANQVLASPTTGAVVVSLIGPYSPSTYTLDGVLYGNGTSAIQATSAVANGVLITNNASIPSFLPNGTVGQLLTATAGPPAWMTPSSSGVTSITGDATIVASPSLGDVTLALAGPYAPFTFTTNGVLYGNATGAILATPPADNGVFISSNAGVPNFLALGTIGQVLTVTPGGPLWQTPAASGLVWSVNNAGGAAVVGVGNIITSGTVTFTLPVAPTVGDQIGFLLSPTGTQWLLTSSGEGSIYYGNSSTPAGTHYLESTAGTVGGTAILLYVGSSMWVVLSTSINSGIQIV